MGHAARHGAIPANPVRDMGRVPGARRGVKARSLSLAECRRWIAQLEADPTAVRRDLPDLTRWFLATGVRIGEAIAVDWSVIDMDRGLVEIDYKVIRVKGSVRPGPDPPDEIRTRAPHAAPATVRDRMLERRITASGVGPLFPDFLGGWRDPSNLSRELREARGSGEFGWVTSHVFRKTCATLLDEGELSARQIADQPGHAKVSMTQDNYLGRRLTAAAPLRPSMRRSEQPWGRAKSCQSQVLILRGDSRRSLTSQEAPPTGFEPVTTRLTVECSAVELRRTVRTAGWPRRPREL